VTTAAEAGLREDVWLGEQLGRPAFTVEADAELDADALAEHDRAHGGAFYQAKMPLDAIDRIARLSALGFYFVDANLQIERPPGPPPAVRSQVTVGRIRPDQRAAVLGLAERSFNYDRFHLDPAIASEAANRIKRAWVESYIEGRRGDWVLVAEAEGRPVGFLCMLTPIVMDLMAVDPDMRGGGAAGAMTAQAITDAGEGEPMRLGTQAANVGATRLYERLGFLVRSAQAVMHRHAPAERT
jgi:ribosomal protein S18 acetylase RimI-like enzyme